MLIMSNDEQYYTGDTPDKRKTPKRTWVYTVLIILILWVTLAHHVIVVTEGPAVAILTKATWSFNNSYILENTWENLRSDLPVLSERLDTGEGFWLFGEME